MAGITGPEGPSPVPRRDRTGAARPAPRTAGELVERSRAWLAARGLESARLEAELLCAHALGLDRLGLFLALDRPVLRAEVDRARELVVRRARGEPAGYLLGQREFYGRPFAVGPGVLVPRPETELLVDAARERFGGRPEPCGQGLVVAELGTGSGCLAITLALELPGARVVASDVSEPALAYARRNGERHGAAVEWVLGDGLEPLLERAGGALDLLVSNPPYVDREADDLAPDVREHEPPEALFAPAGDRQHWVRALVGAAGVLRPGGLLLVELGAGQAEDALAIARRAGRDARVLPDLAGIGRVLVVET